MGGEGASLVGLVLAWWLQVLVFSWRVSGLAYSFVYFICRSVCLLGVCVVC